MSLNIQNLIKTLGTKPQDKEVEFIVVGIDGEIICIDIENNIKDISAIFEMLASVAPKNKDKEQLQSIIAELEGKLEKAMRYQNHSYDCVMQNIDCKGECICGLDKQLKEIGGE